MKRMTLFAVLLLFLFGPPAALSGQERKTDARAAYKVALGRSLFRSDLLSGREGMSCATCHEPQLSFADGQIESPGVLGIGVGRNSPALWAVATVAKFPGPDLEAADPFARPAALTLAERCLVPIENPLEMASSLDETLARINASKAISTAFDRAFGRILGRIEERHLGEALAAFLESLAPPESPYRAHLAGDESALNMTERTGLRIFEGRGRCSSCHSGPGLSDGLVHPVFLPGSERAASQARREAELAQDLDRSLRGNEDFQVPETGIGQAFLVRLRPTRAAGGCDDMGRTASQGGYGGGGPPPFPQLQTLSLWDVKRTGPYFRDGSEQDLGAALRRHVAELREVAAGKSRIRKLHRTALRADRGRARPPLAPTWLARDGASPIAPGALSPGDLRALEAFLGALSPRE